MDEVNCSTIGHPNPGGRLGNGIQDIHIVEPSFVLLIIACLRTFGKLLKFMGLLTILCQNN